MVAILHHYVLGQFVTQIIIKRKPVFRRHLVLYRVGQKQVYTCEYMKQSLFSYYFYELLYYFSYERL